MQINKNAVIFGGSGFIGVFFAKHLLSSGYDKVYLYDKELVSEKKFPYRTNIVQSESRIIEIRGDVRQEITWTPDEHIDLVANFAAVHREPGHEPFEYYETNLLGAENVCAWANLIACKNIIFTSSISPYGACEDEKDESSLPVPITPYGGSKLAAEKIHQTWFAEDTANRHLVIVRPGVVFGPGEGGNVSRLIKAVLHGYFFYMGNRHTRKAGIYVKELCSALLWVLEKQKEQNQHLSIFNMSMNPGPSIQEYVETTCDVAGVKRFIPSVPFFLLISIAWSIEVCSRPFGINHPFSPVRIRKLVRSNNVLPNYLVRNGYKYKFSLKTAFIDWKKDNPDEWN